MPVQLKGSNGYYSREVEISGSVFRIRELTDDELAQFGGGVTGLQAQIEEAGDVTGAEVVTKGIALVADGWAVIDGVLRAGLVGWDIEGAECTPENVVLLPNVVKRALSREIIADSGLTNEEEAFLGG